MRIASTRGNTKSRRKSKRRRNTSASKRSRPQHKDVLKPEKMKFSIPVPEGENVIGNCGIFVIKFVEYILENKTKEIPKKFDAKVARHNIVVQLYKFAIEKPKSHLDE
ncbi:Papain-like cysteine peptidase superfamily [Forsythia ovata]|uniref:Papain-like cysteine peptidase superfamily n=1 Tax=Forsythia ovata TaxID=205694 RepID=A0ABD1WJD8_9LAMI